MRIATSWWSLLCLAGCTFADAGPRATRNTCSSDGECGSGEMCDATLDSCVSMESAGYEVVLRVQPSSSTSAVPMVATRFAPFRLGGAVVTRELQIETPSVLRGRVALVSEDGSTTPVTADLVFTPTHVSAGPPAEALSVASAADFTVLASKDDANYAVALRSGSAYRLSVRPFGASTPLVPPREIVLSRAEVRSGLVDILYEDLHTFRGRIRTWDDAPVTGMDDEGEVRPLRLSVQVVDAQTLESISSRGVTDAEGRFNVQMVEPPGSPEEVRLQFAPTPEATQSDGGTRDDPGTKPEADATLLAPWFGILTVPPSAVEVTGDEHVVTLPHEDDRVDVRSRAEGPGPTFRAVTGAEFEFDGRVPYELADGARVEATLLQNARSDDKGEVSVALWPGLYEVRAFPPSDDTSTSSSPSLAPLLRSGFEAFPQSSGLQRGEAFTFSERTLFSGEARDSMARPLSGVKVRTSPVPADDLPDVAALARSSSSVTTDETGLYEISVDVGLFDWIFEPAEGSGFAWHVVVEQRVGIEARQGTVDAQLGAPVVLTGRVTFEGGRSPEGASLSAFARVDGGQAEPRYVRIGRALVDEQGEYRLNLPPQAPKGRQGSR